MSEAHILGVDPGLSGALAVLDNIGRLIHAEEMPVAGGAVAVPLLHDILAAYPIGRVVVEQVHSMPGQGVSSTFKFGQSYGTVLGFFGGARIPVAKVAPQTWKAAYRLNGKPKDAARALAIEMWPDAAPLLRLKKHTGRADAALIARWSLGKTGTRLLIAAGYGTGEQ